MARPGFQAEQDRAAPKPGGASLCWPAARAIQRPRATTRVAPTACVVGSVGVRNEPQRAAMPGAVPRWGSRAHPPTDHVLTAAGNQIFRTTSKSVMSSMSIHRTAPSRTAAKRPETEVAQDCDSRLREVVRQEQERRWRENHADFIVAYNADPHQGSKFLLPLATRSLPESRLLIGPSFAIGRRGCRSPLAGADARARFGV